MPPARTSTTEKPIMNANKTAPRVEAPNFICPDAAASSQQTYDDVSPNPHGREVSDRSNRRTSILSCRHYLNVATMNVRTIRRKFKRQELADNCSSKSIAILGINDHKIVHENDPVLYESYGKYTLITTSAWRNSNNAASGGVGLMISKTAESALAEVKPWNDRILIAHFTGNGFPTLSIIVHYSPTEGSQNAEEHYKNLLAAIHEIPKHNVLLVMGDFNAHLGKDVAKYTYHDQTNNNGKLVSDLIEEAGLIATNTVYRKKPGKLWTFISDMSGSKTQVDFIMVNKKWRNTIKNCEAYSSFSSIGSDHRIITAKIKLSLRTSRTPPREIYDWNVLCDLDTSY